MPAEKTRADALRMFLTGASTHSGAQADDNLSLGNHISSTEVQSYNWNIASPIANINVLFVSGAHATGAGTLTASGTDDLKWTPPGGTQGSAVTILNGETKICEGGGAGEENEYIRVTRTSAAALTGAATITLTDKLGNVIGLDDVTSAEQTAGDDEYRCIAMENVGVADITALKLRLGLLGTQVTTDGGQLGASGAGTIQTTGSFDTNGWPEEGFATIYNSSAVEQEIVYYASRTATVLTVPAAGRGLLGTSATAGAASDTADAISGIGIGLDAPTSQPAGTFVDNTGADEDTAPAGVTFTSPIFVANELSIGTLIATNIEAYWIHRETPAGAVAKTNALHDVIRTFDAA